MIDRNTGNIFHIDFGYYLSNAPGISLIFHLTYNISLGGKVELEAPVPYKLL
jgi:hypothetical protein